MSHYSAVVHPHLLVLHTSWPHCGCSLCKERIFNRWFVIRIQSIKIQSTGMLKASHLVCWVPLFTPSTRGSCCASRHFTHSDTDTCTTDTVMLNSLLSNTYVHRLTWGHSCSALWIWGSAWQRSRLPAGIAPVWCLQWNWTCQTWPGRTQGMSYFHHLKGNGFTIKLPVTRTGWAKRHLNFFFWESSDKDVYCWK